MNTTTLYDLSSSKKIIAFSGEDAAHFLQGQTTCDVLALKNSDAVFGAVCNPKGRVITLFHLIKHDETYYMVLSSDMASIIIKRMKMFVFRSKVEITDASNDYKVFGINQPLPPAMSSLLAPLKSIKYQSDSELSLLIVATQQYTTAKTDPSIALQSNETDWQLLLINECIPEITTETSELFIPQMLNMDLLNGINFQKGCYTGQEVVARMHYKGTVKRRLVQFHTEKDRAAGESIHCPDDPNSVGTILNSLNIGGETNTGLVVLKTSFINDEALQLDDKSELTLHKPTYGLGE
ncbi:MULTISPECIES: YgfZ/GcvT domain-containing protein [Cycloclasticus]|jgi:folate-binding protein YgfZ|nr:MULTISPECIES: folate-binding protein YgfZ [Cycloclasticus]MDF1828911.1 folate-binding protein YgfZ [Cycloclasticus pugetii]